MASKLCDSIHGVSRLRDQKHIRLRADDCDESFPENWVVFDA
jgi:hypothetical protein